MTYPAHLEKMVEGETGGPTSCNWTDAFTDYDGTLAGFSCGEKPEWWLVFKDPMGWADVHEGSHDDDILAYEFCRPHANLALIDARRM